jgi:hypothetical protein
MKALAFLAEDLVFETNGHPLGMFPHAFPFPDPQPNLNFTYVGSNRPLQWFGFSVRT